jgi:catechol 2,3-dioxygenase-like lactoylglutathione lyase family enzyme
MILDHIGLNVSDFVQSKKFFTQALHPLGIGIVKEGESWAGIGKNAKGQFWFRSFGKNSGPIHIAFAAETGAQVREFYAAALAAGGKDNGAPGVRAQYTPNLLRCFCYRPRRPQH